jgi:hypothetical protein
MKDQKGSRVNIITLSLTSALDWVGGQRHALAALSPSRDMVPVVQDVGVGPSVCLGGYPKPRLTVIRSPKRAPGNE